MITLFLTICHAMSGYHVNILKGFNFLFLITVRGEHEFELSGSMLNGGFFVVVNFEQWACYRAILGILKKFNFDNIHYLKHIAALHVVNKFITELELWKKLNWGFYGVCTVKLYNLGFPVSLNLVGFTAFRF